MLYTSIYGHFDKVYVKEGYIINPGDKIGKMGNTGKSFGNHVHYGLLPGTYDRIVRMKESTSIVSGLSEDQMLDLFRQYHYFLDHNFFGITAKEHTRKKNPLDIVITAGFGEPKYGGDSWLFHCGFDLVPSDRHVSQNHFDVINNRSKQQTVVKTGFDNGYGNYVVSQIRV